MTLGDWITWGTVALGIWALSHHAWRRWGAPLRARVLSVTSSPTPEITSSRAPDAAPIASPPRTDGGADGRTPIAAPELRPVSLDTARELRAHGFTRDAARAMLRREGLSLGNNTWADAAPVATDDDEIVTPYAGRRTKARYYPDNPELEYAEPTT